jgi:hypothetical protein
MAIECRQNATQCSAVYFTVDDVHPLSTLNDEEAGFLAAFDCFCHFSSDTYGFAPRKI